MQFPLLTSKLFFYKLWASLNLYWHNKCRYFEAISQTSSEYYKRQKNRYSSKVSKFSLFSMYFIQRGVNVYQNSSRNSSFLSIQHSHITPHLQEFHANVDILHKKTQNKCTSCLRASNPKLLVNHLTVSIFTQFYFCITFFSQEFFLHCL